MAPTGDEPLFGDDPAAPASAITAANYTEKACEWIRRNSGAGVVIRNAAGRERTGGAETPDAWAAWLGYFAWLKHPTVFAQKHGVMTVPTEFPWIFDVAAPTDVKPPPTRSPGRVLTAAERAERAEESKRLMRAHPMYQPDKRRAVPTRQQAANHLQEAKAEFQREAPAVSASLAGKMGLHRTETAAWGV